MGNLIGDLTGLGSVFDFGSKIVDKLFPDKADADKAKLQLLQLQQEGEFKELEATLQMAKNQSDINLADAQSGSNFRGGWRPFVGWVCGIGLLYSLILRSIIMSVVDIWVPGFALAPVDSSTLTTLLLSLLGLGGYRTWERVKKVIP